MSKSLAELRATPAPSLPEVPYKVCLDQSLLREANRLRSEQEDIEAERAPLRAEQETLLEQIGASAVGEGEGKPKRNYDPSVGRLSEITKLTEALVERAREAQAKMAAIWDQMREVEGELTLRAIDGGEWQRWKDKHPAREGNVSDEQTCYGFCNTADLMADLGRYVVAWEGEELSPTDWSGWLAKKVAPADLREMCMVVVQMHETKVSVPKSLTVSSETPGNASS